MPIPTQSPAEKQSSAKEKVYKQVARWIIDGTMVPGEKLNEGEIAAWFSVSRTPVHEALIFRKCYQHGFPGTVRRIRIHARGTERKIFGSACR